METLVLFAKAPHEAKTRLAQVVGEAATASLALAFLEDTADLLRQWANETVSVDQNRRIAIYTPNVDDATMQRVAHTAGARLERQVGDDLGARMRQAFAQEFERGARAVCAIGSDAPHLPLHLVDEAFRALLWHDVAFGPSFDGGYWLVGAVRPAPDIFTQVPWSTPHTLDASLARARALSASAALLPYFFDVDEAADLLRLTTYLRHVRQGEPGLCRRTWPILATLGDAQHP